MEALAGLGTTICDLDGPQNLSYLLSAKKLNSRQARWALSQGCFNYTLMYRPGTHNVKPDALSHQQTPEIATPEPETILALSCVVVAALWEEKILVQDAQWTQQVTVFLTAFLFMTSQVLQWGHSSKLACHPGFNRSLQLIWQLFWWLSMSCDTCVFVSPCSVCARSKTSHQPSAGLLRPLPIPNQPWSHIVVTALPPLNGNTTILTGVDHFSKAVYFVPLSKLPTASETADLLVLHILQLHGIPHDIVSDRGPQFSTQVW